MQITEQIQGAVTVLRPQGPLVQDVVADFRSRMAEAIRRSLGRVVIDAGAVTFVDSGGLESLVDAADELASGGRTLRICAINDTLREVLDLTDLTPAFEIYEDVNTAVRSFV